MKTFLVLAAVIALAGLSASQTMKPASTHHRRADDSRCFQLRFQSNSAMPSYNGQGFSTVSYSDPDEPFIVPCGMFSVFLFTARRDVPSTELSQSDSEELFAHDGYQRITRLYAHGQLRFWFGWRG
jgi:hypothetical protein